MLHNATAHYQLTAVTSGGRFVQLQSGKPVRTVDLNRAFEGDENINSGHTHTTVVHNESG